MQKHPLWDNPVLVGGIGLLVLGLSIWIGRAFMVGGIRPMDIVVGAALILGGWYLIQMGAEK